MSYFNRTGSVLTITLTALLLAACGGGGGGSNSGGSNSGGSNSGGNNGGETGGDSGGSPTPKPQRLTFAHPTNYSVWSTDGTTAGTVKLSDASSTEIGALRTSGRNMFSQTLKDKTFFVGIAYDGENNVGNAKTRTALWSSEGTAATTSLFKDLDPDSTSGANFTEKSLKVFYAGSDYIYFLAGNNTNQLWISSTQADSTRKIATTTGQFSRPYVYGNNAYVFDDGDQKLYRYTPTSGNSETKTKISISYQNEIYALLDSIEYDGAIYFLARGLSNTYVLKLNGDDTSLHYTSLTVYTSGRLANVDGNFVVNIGTNLYDITPGSSDVGRQLGGDYYIPTHYDITGSENAFFYADKNTGNSTRNIYYKNSLTKEDDVLLQSNTPNGYASLIKNTIYTQVTGKIFATNLAKTDTHIELPCTSALTDFVGTLGDYVFIYNYSTEILYKTKGVLIDKFNQATIECDQVYQE